MDILGVYFSTYSIEQTQLQWNEEKGSSPKEGMLGRQKAYFLYHNLRFKGLWESIPVHFIYIFIKHL